MKLKILVLTDHTGHSQQNSLYALARAMYQHPCCAKLDAATRGEKQNRPFFDRHQSDTLIVTAVDQYFEFHRDGRIFKENLRTESVHSYDVIWLRMPPPLSADFLNFLSSRFSKQLIINSPEGILETGSKSFLMNFQDLCPPMKICRSVEDIIAFKNRFPIVLKPFREYGGKGIIRIDGDRVWEGTAPMSLTTFFEKMEETEIEYLGVKFLKRVSEGDRRIIIVNGEIMGASLRLPAANSWICNVAMGGDANRTEVDDTERAIVAEVDTVLSEMGIVMYGIDTLQGDEGKRVLSEINTTSIGGLPQIAVFNGQPLVERAIELIFEFIKTTWSERISL